MAFYSKLKNVIPSLDIFMEQPSLIENSFQCLGLAGIYLFMQTSFLYTAEVSMWTVGGLLRVMIY